MPCDPVYAEIQMSKPEPKLLQPLDHAPAEPVLLPKKKKKAKKKFPEDKYKPKS